MKQIIQSQSTIQSILGKQTGFPNNIKESQFLIKFTLSDGFLLYSVLTKELLYLTKEEISDSSIITYLYENWFLVSEKLDENELCKQISSVLSFSSSKIIPRTFTILTTTNCNAHCFYCFEKNRKNITMSLDIANKVADYIISKHDKTAPICLRWFGGEPLMNTRVIDYICEQMHSHFIPFTSRFITNGYLLTDDIVDIALSKWNLDLVQITLDGTQKIYNSVKSIDMAEDAYSQVINNINYLLLQNVKVRIRLNLDMYNSADLLELVQLLIEKFGSFSTLKIYIALLFEKSGNKERARNQSDRQHLYQIYDCINDMLSKAGLAYSEDLPKTIKRSQCMADSRKAVVISPDGHLGLCEHFSDSEFFGSVFSDEIDNEMIESWQEHAKLPECSLCPLSPECIRVKKCLENSFCSDEKRQYRINEIKQLMLKEYQNYQIQQERNRKVDTKKNYEIAGKRFLIETLFYRTHQFGVKYLIPSNSNIDCSLKITEKDILLEQSNMPDLMAITQNLADFEFLAVQRKVTEALLDYDTILFHASALAMDGKGYLFTALSGTGKSTHSRLWREQFGDRVTMINDDKPFIHIGEDEARVYGSPWDGKHHLSTNTSVPIKAIVILTRDTTNHIERINADEAFPILYQQTQRFKEPEKLIKIMDLLKLLTDRVELYRLGCNMDPEAAIVSYEGMNHE